MTVEMAIVANAMHSSTSAIALPACEAHGQANAASSTVQLFHARLSFRSIVVRLVRDCLDSLGIARQRQRGAHGEGEAHHGDDLEVGTRPVTERDQADDRRDDRLHREHHGGCSGHRTTLQRTREHQHAARAIEDQRDCDGLPNDMPGGDGETKRASGDRGTGEAEARTRSQTDPCARIPQAGRNNAARRNRDDTAQQRPSRR